MKQGTGRKGPWKWVSLLLFVFFVLGGGTLVGLSFQPGDWYANLEKPWFNPPGWIFGPVWSLLYVLIAVAGWRTWRRGPASLEMQLWFGQLALNFMWTPAFFGMHLPGLAFFVLAAMLLVIMLFIRRSWHADRVTAVLFLPYAVWVAFAGLLNVSIWLLN